jgi:hypothetical protein
MLARAGAFHFERSADHILDAFFDLSAFSLLAFLSQGKHRPETLLTCRPQELLLSLILSELEVAASVVLCTIPHHGDILLNAVLSPCEFEEYGSPGFFGVGIHSMPTIQAKSSVP